MSSCISCLHDKQQRPRHSSSCQDLSSLTCCSAVCVFYVSSHEFCIASSFPEPSNLPQHLTTLMGCMTKLEGCRFGPDLQSTINKSERITLPLASKASRNLVHHVMRTPGYRYVQTCSFMEDTIEPFSDVSRQIVWTPASCAHGTCLKTTPNASGCTSRTPHIFSRLGRKGAELFK